MIKPGDTVEVCGMDDFENGIIGVVQHEKPENDDDFLVKITVPTSVSHFYRGDVVSYAREYLVNANHMAQDEPGEIHEAVLSLLPFV